MTADLIARLTEATEGSRELDGDIAYAVLRAGGDIRLEGMSDDAVPLKTFFYPDGSVGTALRYTASLDAALTLIPAHHLWEVKQGIEARAIVWKLERDYDDYAPPTGFHMSSPVLALAIAALKARQESGNG